MGRDESSIVGHLRQRVLRKADGEIQYKLKFAK
jgi:hypothetical protein